MQVFLCVLNKQTNARMSKVHSNTPRVAEGMKEHVAKLQKMFGGEYVVARFIQTKKGLKRL